jgi:hypothetical protein
MQVAMNYIVGVKILQTARYFRELRNDYGYRG